MSLDLRLPMGLMFTLIGLALVLFGNATTHTDIYAKSLNMNVNLYWGLVLLVFGGVMVMLGRIGQNRINRQLMASDAMATDAGSGKARSGNLRPGSPRTAKPRLPQGQKKK